MKQNKILSILLSLVIAVCLWTYVVTTVTPEDTQWVNNIPVTFTNEDGLFADRNLTLTQGRDFTVNLRCTGNRQELLKLNNSNITVSVDLSQVTGPGSWSLQYDYELPETVSTGSITVDARSTYRVDILVDKLSVKEIEVRAVLDGSIADGYMQEPIELEYESLSISGPQEQVALIDHAQVVLSRENVSKTVSDTLSYTFMDEAGNPVEANEVNCEVEKIGVLMPVYMVKDVPLVVSYVEGGGAYEQHAVATISPETVTIKGEAEDLEVLNYIAVGPVYLGDVQNTFTGEFTIGVPNGMENMTSQTAEVTVELKNLKERTFRVTNLEVANKPEHLDATIGTVSLSVKLRGDTTIMNSITTSNIRAVADLASLGNSVGQFSVPVTIYVDGYSEVGAMGTYSVVVTMAEPQEEEPVETVVPSSGDMAVATEEPSADETHAEDIVA